jgi:hypothetical protein
MFTDHGRRNRLGPAPAGHGDIRFKSEALTVFKYRDLESGPGRHRRRGRPRPALSSLQSESTSSHGQTGVTSASHCDRASLRLLTASGALAS